MQLLEQEFERDNPPEYLAGQSRMMQHLGLLPPGADLQAMLLELLGSQVARSVRPEHEGALRHLDGRAGSGRSRRSRTRTSTTTRSRTRTSTSIPMLDVGLDQSDKGSPGWPSSKATRRSS